MISDNTKDFQIFFSNNKAFAIVQKTDKSDAIIFTIFQCLLLSIHECNKLCKRLLLK